VLSVDWPGATVLRLRLGTQKPLHYRAGQHLLLWSANGVARPYSLASLPGEDAWLEFHIDCRLPGAFSDAARQLQPGDRLRLGELGGGALHYDGDWQTRPLWLLAAGTGLAPLWALLREALRQHHQGEIRVLHVAREHYLAEPLRELARHHSQLRVDLIGPDELGACLAGLKLASRQTVGLLCGSAASVETFARRLYLAGMPRNQVHADVFLSRVE
jgi:NAD(P)H-flavin reductase